MRYPMRLLTVACTLGALAAPLAAQPPAGGGPRGPGGGAMAGPGGGQRPAEFLLAHTGELQLTDQQVVRLAAIARRGDARRRAERATVDSAVVARRRAPGDTTRRARPAPPFDEAAMQQLRDQERTDLRDALAVLTADQQATVWMMRGPRAVAPFAGARAPRGMGGGAGAPGGRGPASFRPRRPGDDDAPPPGGR